MKSLEGQLLVASPYLGDGNFNKSVVLMIQHNEHGAFGVVLNRPTENRIRDLWDQVSDEPCPPCDLPIHLGGPIEGPLMALHSERHLADSEVVSGVHFTASKDNLLQLIKNGAGPLHIYSGYSGWGATQLEVELEEGAWLIYPATDEHIFLDANMDLWKLVAKEINNQIVVDTLDIKHIPNDPSWN